MSKAEDFVKKHFKGIENYPLFLPIVAIAEGFAEEQNKEAMINLLDWLDYNTSSKTNKETVSNFLNKTRQ